MRCPHCRHDNPDNARFCNQCAHALLRLAGSGAVPDRFALEGERKQVSVLFADTKGSMQLLAGLDPEEARNLLDPMLEHMMEAVHHYEGTVNQVMGDGIMALFGAPIAVEDHAARACCAALRMQASVARHGEALRRAGATAPQIRVGVNSGEVVVRSIDTDLHMDYTAVGETTHLAARMEQLASAGSILITAETLHLAQASVQVKPLGPTPVAGLREAVNVYELVAAGPARSPVYAAQSRGLTRFVGRGGELAVLADALDVAGRGHGQVVTIVGAAGIGKSRLLREFVHSSHTHGWLVLETGCVAFGKASGYRPVIEALKIHFAITEQDDPARVRERVRAKLLALGVSLEPGLAALWALLDVLPADSPWPRLDPGQRQRLIVHAVKELVLSECQVQPVVMVFEDLHWADAESLAVLDALVDALPGANLLLLASRRPESGRTWRRETRELNVDALPRTAAEELLDALLGDASELHDLRRQLFERTEGNPFFIEECVSALRETGVLAGTPGACRPGQAAAALKVPPTVQAILAARIDRLAPDDKRLLQAAAVVGQSVALALLQSVAALPADALRQALARLQTAELLCRSTPLADPACTYTFKHALTHEVAYASLLAARRRELHARVVAAIEDVHRGRIAEHVEQLAHHALCGGLKEKAIRYLQDAGTKAALRSAHFEAAALFEQALDVAAGLPETRAVLSAVLELRIGLGLALRASKGDWDASVEACYASALELCDRLGETSRRVPLLFGLWACHYSRGEYERANDCTTRLLQLAGDGDVRLQLEARHASLSTAVAAGRPAQAMPDLYARPQDHRPELSADGVHSGETAPMHWQQMAAIGELLLGRFDQARDSVVRGLQLAKQSNHSVATVLAHHVAAVVYYHRGERGAAMLHAKAASSLGHAFDVMGWPDHASVVLARLWVEEARVHEAIRLVQASLPGSLRAGWPWSASISFALAADLYGRAGQPAVGLEMLRSLEPDRYAGLYGPELQRLHAVLLLMVSPQATHEAEARLRDAVAQARERRLGSLELRAAMSLARVLAPRDRGAARAALALVEGFSEGRDVADLRAARVLLQWLS